GVFTTVAVPAVLPYCQLATRLARAEGRDAAASATPCGDGRTSKPPRCWWRSCEDACERSQPRGLPHSRRDAPEQQATTIPGRKSMKRLMLVLPCLVALLVPHRAEAQQTIKVGFPMILSGPGALFGEPALKGAQMYVEEINGKGGVLGRKLELITRDTKGNADEAVRVSRELILKDNVDFLVGTLTSAEGPAVSTIAKENKIVFIAPIPKTDQLTAPANLHPYELRTASNTTIEGRTAAEIVA